jgi:hypothetical protein
VVTVVSSADAARLRQAQIGVRRLVERDLAEFFGSLNLGRPEAARDALLGFVPVLVAQYGESAASVAADWYDDVRASERVPGRFRALMQESPYQSAVTDTVRRAAGALFSDNPGATLLALSATTGKYALAAGRETITASTARDPRASGWQRVTRGGACGFCRMLAGRGAVYRDGTAHFASHGDCNCAAVPSWDPDAPEVDVTLYRASQRTTNMTPAQRERHNALIERAIGEYAH